MTCSHVAHFLVYSISVWRMGFLQCVPAQSLEPPVRLAQVEVKGDRGYGSPQPRTEGTFERAKWREMHLLALKDSFLGHPCRDDRGKGSRSWEALWILESCLAHVVASSHLISRFLFSSTGFSCFSVHFLVMMEVPLSSRVSHWYFSLDSGS